MEVFGENILIVIAIESSLRPLLLNTPVEDPTCFTDKWRFVFEPTELPFIADRNCTHFIDCTSTATSTNPCLLLGQAFFKINPLLNEISDWVAFGGVCNDSERIVPPDDFGTIDRTILSVHRSFKSWTEIKSSNKQQTDELFIIVKLTILLGLPWILSLLQGIFNNVYLLWVSVIVNSLQGVLMLATFLLTPSVRKILRIPRCIQKDAVPTKEGTKAKKELNNTSTITTKL
ncbi:hypothetical protein BSL78_20587 [Apostichopus japonicus]|uniref:G-protein coupled receptor n=1 Tax=Stichopus japonicus TaxID=307972 RepID=A0A2G8K3J0_STIJA|nr:hypothetical protein BSL78_20587 [Apostichopus japonicus]